ncbi:UDP-glycosyltransferase 90A1-like [Carex rostrata]
MDSTHIAIFPFMSKGHTIPLLHLAHLLHHRHLVSHITFFTTPLNAPFIRSSLSLAIAQNTSIVALPLPDKLPPDIPPGTESTDQLPSSDLFLPFVTTIPQLRPAFFQAISCLSPRPSLLISDGFLSWTQYVATELSIPCLFFYGMSGFAQSVSMSVCIHKPHAEISSPDEPFPVPGFPHLMLTTADLEQPFEWFRKSADSELTRPSRLGIGGVRAEFYPILAPVRVFRQNSDEQCRNRPIFRFSGRVTPIQAELSRFHFKKFRFPTNLDCALPFTINLAFDDPEPKGPHWDFVVEQVEAMKNSCGFVMNGFYELEQPYFDYMDKMGVNNYQVGSLCLARLGTDKKNQSQSPLLDWLDSRLSMNHPVLYVAFGTQIKLSPIQMKELATGLERSGLYFIWVTRGEKSNWHDGFAERVGVRCRLVNEWVDQTEILAHKAVYGFMSHCGWNSVMETLCAGVPVLAWPMIAEQRLNAKFVVEELKMGLRIRASDGIKDSLVEAEEIER